MNLNKAQPMKHSSYPYEVFFIPWGSILHRLLGGISPYIITRQYNKEKKQNSSAFKGVGIFFQINNRVGIIGKEFFYHFSSAYPTPKEIKNDRISNKSSSGGSRFNLSKK